MFAAENRSVRKRLPSAADIAVASPGATTEVTGSPMPPGFSVV